MPTYLLICLRAFSLSSSSNLLSWTRFIIALALSLTA
jgi:hypothetical protein